MTAESKQHLKDIELHSTTLTNKKRSERVTVSFFRSIDSAVAPIYETRVTSSEGDITVYRGTVRDTAANEYSDCITRYVGDGFKITKIYNAEVDAK